MKREVWLKTNYRAHWLLALVPTMAAAGASGLVFLARSTIWTWLGGAVLAATTAWLWFALMHTRLPRLAYVDGMLLVYLRGMRPVELPIGVVECFFLGQGASFLPRSLAGRDGAAETSTVVVRLAESAKEWHHLDVRPSLGHWCEGYITIRGTWCEPLSGDVVAGLNQRLIAVHRAQKRVQETVPA